MAKFIVGDKLIRSLYDAGAIGDDYESIRRVVIDLELGHVAKLYIERYGDDDQLIAGLTGGSIQVVETAEEAGKTTGKTLPRPGEKAA